MYIQQTNATAIARLRGIIQRNSYRMFAPSAPFSVDVLFNGKMFGDRRFNTDSIVHALKGSLQYVGLHWRHYSLVDYTVMP
jgi:hypothetical protein